MGSREDQSKKNQNMVMKWTFFQKASNNIETSTFFRLKILRKCPKIKIQPRNASMLLGFRKKWRRWTAESASFPSALRSVESEQ